MSLEEFQRALCDLTLDPQLAARVRRQGAVALEGYSLTLIEQTRLTSACRQPGMDLNCTLARANRFASIAIAYPLTCSLLKPQLSRLLDELWSDHRPDNYQLSGEEDAFAALLQNKIARSEITHPYADEVFRFERVSWELMQGLRKQYLEGDKRQGPERFATFVHDPRILIPLLEEDRTPPPDLPTGTYRVKVRLQGDALEVDLAD